MAARQLPMQDSATVSPQVGPVPYSNTRYSPEDFGAGAGRALQNAGQELDQVRMKANAYVAQDLDNQFSSEVRELMYGKEDPTNGKDRGFLLRTGAAALDAKPMVDAMDKLIAKYADMTQNPEQRQAFLARAQARYQSVTQAAEEHAGVQRRVYYKTTAEGAADEALRNVETNYTSTDEIEKQLAIVKPILIVQWAHEEGLPPESIAENWKRFESIAMLRALAGYTSADDGIGGLKFVNQPGVKERLGQDGYNKAVTGLKPIADKQEALALAQSLYEQSFDQHKPMPGKPGEEWPQNRTMPGKPDVEWAQARLQEMLHGTGEAPADGSAPKALRPEVFEAANDLLNKKAARFVNEYDQVTDRILGQAKAIYSTRHDLTEVPENIKQALMQRDGAWLVMENLDRQWQQANSSEHTPPTMAQRRVAVQFAMDLATTPHRFDNMSMEEFDRKYGQYMHPNDYEQAGYALARTQGRPDRLLEGLQPIVQMYHRKGSGKLFPDLNDPDPDKRNPANWSQEDTDRYYFGLNFLQQKLADWHKEDHKEAAPSMEEYGKWVDEITAAGWDPSRRRWFGPWKPTVRGAALADNTPFEADPAKMSLAMRNQIVAQLRAGIPGRVPPNPNPSDKDIADLYTFMLNKDVPEKSAFWDFVLGSK